MFVYELGGCGFESSCSYLVLFDLFKLYVKIPIFEQHLQKTDFIAEPGLVEKLVDSCVSKEWL